MPLSGKKTFLLSVALIITLVCSACGGRASNDKSIGFSVPVEGVYTEAGSAWVSTTQGKALEIKGDIKSAIMSPDGKQAAYIEGETLNLLTSSNEEKRQIASDCKTIVALRNAGILYQKNDGAIMRYLFSTGAEYRLGYSETYMVADYSLNIAYVVDNKIFYLSEQSEKREDLGNYADTVSFERVLDDTDVVLWTDRSANADTLMLFQNGKRAKLTEFSPGYESFDFTWVEFDSTQTWMTAINLLSSKMILLKIGEEPTVISLRGRPQSAYAYTADGLFSEHPYGEDGLYMMTGENGEGFYLYYLSPDGGREKLLAESTLMDLNGGWVCYQKDDEALYCARVDKGELSEERQIATNVTRLSNQAGKGGLFYFRSDVNEEDLGTLCAYRGGDSDIVTIDHDVAASVLYSPDGNTAFYFKNLSQTKENGGYMGTLFKYSFGEEASEKVSDYVLWGGVNSGITPERLKWNIFAPKFANDINPESFLYEQFIETTKKSVLFDWMFFDGTQSIKLASNVSRSRS